MRTGPVTKDVSTVALGLAQIRVGVSAANVSNPNVCFTSADSMGAMADTKMTSNVEYWKLTSGFPALEDLSIPLSESCSFECVFKEITPRNMALARGIDPFSVGTGFSATAVGAVLSAGGVGDPSKPAGTFGAGAKAGTYTITFSSASAYTVTAFDGTPITGTGALGSASAFQMGGQPAFTLPAAFVTGTIAAGDVFRFSISKDGYADNHAGEIALGGMKAPEFVRMEAVYTYPNGINHMYIIFPRANVSSNLEVAFSATDNAAPTVTFEGKRADSEVAGGHAVWDSRPLGRVYWD